MNMSQDFKGEKNKGLIKDSENIKQSVGLNTGNNSIYESRISKRIRLMKENPN